MPPIATRICCSFRFFCPCHFDFDRRAKTSLVVMPSMRSRLSRALCPRTMCTLPLATLSRFASSATHRVVGFAAFRGYCYSRSYFVAVDFDAVASGLRLHSDIKFHAKRLLNRREPVLVHFYDLDHLLFYAHARVRVLLFSRLAIHRQSSLSAARRPAWLPVAPLS